MISHYWFGVSGSDHLHDPSIELSWWCVPGNAKEGDIILFYCPRSVSSAKQGIFAEAKICFPPQEKRKENSYCTGYGLGKKMRLVYAEIEITERFYPALTAKHMKADPVLGQTHLVRRNFQGTTFPIELKTYQRMKHCLDELARQNITSLNESRSTS